MRVPTITGIIERRILVNFTADPAIVARILPAPFTPKLFNGKAIVGICLIRLKNIRPAKLPAFLGISSENGAHRIAVEWMEDGQLKEGVYIPRRDSSSWLNHLAGGRIFPGKHHLAKFEVQETGNTFNVAFTSSDNTSISIKGTVTSTFKPSSIFGTLDTASRFFKKGELGYSPNGDKYDGMQLKTSNWKVTPLQVSHIQSSFFEDETIFPKGSVTFDHALLMTNISHEWHSGKTICPCEMPSAHQTNTQ
jgi:hypothetical protein